MDGRRALGGWVSADIVRQRSVAAQQVGGVDLRFWCYNKSDRDDLNKKYYQPIVGRYEKSKTHTIKHLLEIAADRLKTAPPPHHPGPKDAAGGPEHDLR